MDKARLLELGKQLGPRLYPWLEEWRERRSSCRLRVAVVGMGKMGLLHAGIAGLLGNRLAAIVDTSRLVVAAGPRVLRGTKFYRSVEEMLGDVEVDAVYVATPPEHHYPVLQALLSTGYRGGLFVEKPPVVRWEEAEELLGKKCECMAGFQKRYAAPLRHARLLLEEGVLGEPLEVRATVMSSDVMEPTKRWDRLGRGVLLDLGIHVVDTLVWLFGGGFRVVEACRKSVYTGVDDYFYLVMERRGVRAVVEASWSTPGYRVPETRISIRAGEGWLETGEDFLRARLGEAHWLLGGLREAALYRPHYYQGIPPVNLADQEYVFENIDFLLSTCTGRPAETVLERVAETVRLVDEAYEYAGECREVVRRAQGGG